MFVRTRIVPLGIEFRRLFRRFVMDFPAVTMRFGHKRTLRCRPREDSTIGVAQTKALRVRFDERMESHE